MSSAALPDWSWTINSAFLSGLISPHVLPVPPWSVTFTRLCFPQHMERLSMLAFHPVKMQSCYEKVEQLNLEGLQQRFDVSNPSVFVSRAQILMRGVRCHSDYLWYKTQNQHVPKQCQDAWKHSLSRLWWSLYFHLLDRKSMTLKMNRHSRGLLSQQHWYFSCAPV